MAHVLQLPSRPVAASLAAGDPDLSLRTDTVYVVYTSAEDTIAALRAAALFATPSDLAVTLLHFRIVPYAQPVDWPCGISPIETDAFAARLAADGLTVRTQVCLCRDERTAIARALDRPSLVFVGGRRWHRQPAERLRRTLKAAGHFVIFVDPSRVREDVHD